MIGLQRAIFLKLSGDDELLNLLGLAVGQESEISKRITPVPPVELSVENQPLIHFRFPQTYTSFRSRLMEIRPMQFRVWSADPSLVVHQQIAERIKALFVGQVLKIADCQQYSNPEYVGETQIVGQVNELYGWAVEMRISTRVTYFNSGG